jgi:transcriptional regulator with XRE-family HTH domain
MSAPESTPESGESFGRRLRRERERRKIELASIAETTKISVSLLQDLERDDVTRWPSGIYRRSFFRAYAQAIGVEPDATTREFLERFPDPNDPERAIVAPPPPASKYALRLTVSDTSSSFSGGRLLASARDRWAAVACDAAIVVTLGLAIAAVLGTLWMPLCLALVGYYAGGILLLGNTPGVCLCAPGGRSNDPPNRTSVGHRVRTAIASTVSAMPFRPRHPARAMAD